MQGIYTYIPETNYVPREYSIAAILLLLFVLLISLVSVLNLLYFYISTFRSMCAVPNMAVFCSLLLLLSLLLYDLLYASAHSRPSSFSPLVYFVCTQVAFSNDDTRRFYAIFLLYLFLSDDGLE